jgi:hypothetical protein
MKARWIVGILIGGAMTSCGGGASNSVKSPPSTAPASTQEVPKVSTLEVKIASPVEGGGWITFDGGPVVALSPTATVSIDGVSVPAAGLSILEGEVAFVTGNFLVDGGNNPGGLVTADRIELSHIVDGPVDSIDLAHDRLTVLGLTILLDGNTSFDDADGDFVQVGERVTVSGHATVSGQVLATAINPSALTGDFLVTAFVTSVDVTQQHLTVGNLLIDYGAATLQGFAATGPAVGDRIRLHGAFSATPATLTASSISYLAPTLAEPAGTVAALHGVVTAVSSPTSAAVDGYGVVLSAAAEKSCGAAPVVNALVTLHGTVQSDGVVLADLFCFDQPPDYVSLNVTGRVDAIDPAFGTLSVLGFEVQPLITTLVTFGGITASLSDIQTGDYVLGQGTGGFGADEVVAWQLVRYASATAPQIEAAYDYIRFADPLVYVHGRAIGTDSNTQFRYIGPDGIQTIHPMTRELFFSNPHYFPYWDRICTPTLRFMVNQSPDGSLTATSVLWEPDYC